MSRLVYWGRSWG